MTLHDPVQIDVVSHSPVQCTRLRIILVKAKGLEWTRIAGDAFSSGWQNETGTICDSEEKGSSKLKSSYWNHIKCNKQEWMSGQFKFERLREVGARRPGRTLKKKWMPISDAAKVSLPGKVKTLNLWSKQMIWSVILPGDTTSQFLFLDDVTMQFRDKLDHLYGEWMMFHNCPPTQQETKDQPRSCLGTGLITVVMKFHINHTVRRFKKYCISYDMNGTEVISCDRKVTKKLF
jgi:hypothetical protein